MSTTYQNPFLQGAPAPASYTPAKASAFLRRVFGIMTLGLVITSLTSLLVAFFASQNEALFTSLYASPIRWVIMLAPLAFVLVLGFGMQRMSSAAALLVFVLYAAVMGVSLSWIFFRFAGPSILQTFIVSGALFAGLALFGAVTKADLTKLGNILMVALGVLVIAMIVNLFMRSSGLSMLFCAVGVIIFAGLTAYDTQKIVQYGAAAEAGENTNKMAIMGALNLYLDFINLFMFLLRLFGGRK